MKHLVIDCDTGRDDAITILLAIKLAFPLRSIITSYGNTGIEQVTFNTCRVLELIKRNDIPVYQGKSMPIRKHRLLEEIVFPRQRNIGNGLCDIFLPDRQIVFPQIMSEEKLFNALGNLVPLKEKLTYLIIGPATNFALLYKKHGEKLKGIVSEIFMMGGKLGEAWDNDPIPDFNIACDPFAFKEILSSGIPINLIPINATMQIFITLDGIYKQEPIDNVSKFVKELMIAHCKKFSPKPIFYFHDPSALIAIKYRSQFKKMKIDVVTEEKSFEFGRIIENKNGFDCNIFYPSSACRDSIFSSIIKSFFKH